MSKKLNEGGGGNPSSLYQIIFDMEISLVENYKLSPFEIRRERFHEFCLLVGRLHDKNKRDKTKKNGKIRRKASDNWF